MKGPINLVRSNKVPEYKNIKPVYEWCEGKAYLVIDKISFKEKVGAILCYYNPPVHQVGNPGLDAYLEGLKKILKEENDLEFLILYGANDPAHAGGDLKESLDKLDRTLEMKEQQLSKGASSEEVDRLFDWADNRLKKGVALHGTIREIASKMRIVAICGGGTRFGGSAEIPLMADFLVGDSRSGMCFSEAIIGLIPGWSGIGRILIKAGPINATYMAKTSREIKADHLKKIGAYNIIVDVPFPLPKKQRTDNPEADKALYLQGLEDHNERTGLLLLPEGLKTGTCPVQDIPTIGEKDRLTLAAKEDIDTEVNRRQNPENYSHLWDKSLREVRDEIARIGKPLAPQSIEALSRLLDNYEPSEFDEYAFVQKEMEADSRLYRDPRFRAGLIATLEQKVADYRLEGL